MTMEKSLLGDIIYILSLRPDAWLFFTLGSGKLPLSYPFMPLLVISLILCLNSCRSLLHTHIVAHLEAEQYQQPPAELLSSCCA